MAQQPLEVLNYGLRTRRHVSLNIQNKRKILLNNSNPK